MKTEPIRPLTLPAHIHLAYYQEQRIPRYKGNVLIEALPLSKSDGDLIESLTLIPVFDEQERQWKTHERMHQLLGLANFMIPLESHIQLARVLDSMMREGYVGRRPLTPEHVRIYQNLYERAREGNPFRQTAETITPQLSTSLIGVSGMGKTTAVRRFLAQVDQVIYHPDLDLYQITYLHVEMPSDGKSIKALATAIIKQIDALLPDISYYKDYVGTGKASASALMQSVAHIMNKHLVGLLVCDEVQNLSNSRKDDQVVMTELVSACNELKVPIVFIGTNKAEKILGLDFRQARRALGFGLGNWDPLPRWAYVSDNGEVSSTPGEWAEFISVLWNYQWVNQPVGLTEGLLNLIYDLTQGVIDLAIKLFVAAQFRAMMDGTETISEQLLVDIYNKDMKLIHPMVDALRRNDAVALMKFEDIKPLGVADMLSDVARRYRAKSAPAATVRPGHPQFGPRLTAAGVAIGLAPADAAAFANEIASDGTAKNMLEGTAQLTKKLSATKPVTKPRKGQSKPDFPVPPQDFSDRPLDYRNAVSEAQRRGSSIAAQLNALSMLPALEDLVPIE